MSIEKSVGDLGQPVTGPSPASASARRQQLAASTYKHSQPLKLHCNRCMADDKNKDRTQTRISGLYKIKILPAPWKTRDFAFGAIVYVE
jgi:hypothetical protein